MDCTATCSSVRSAHSAVRQCLRCPEPCQRVRPRRKRPGTWRRGGGKCKCVQVPCIGRPLRRRVLVATHRACALLRAQAAGSGGGPHMYSLAPSRALQTTPHKGARHRHQLESPNFALLRLAAARCALVCAVRDSNPPKNRGSRFRRPARRAREPATAARCPRATHTDRSMAHIISGAICGAARSFPVSCKPFQTRHVRRPVKQHCTAPRAPQSPHHHP